MQFALPSFAKINWNLRVLGKRDDGFHELFTIFQTVSLHDRLYFADGEAVSLECNDQSIPVDERNLILKAAAALQRATGARKGASILLEKRIPSPGGLGGGSSNAATALIGLMRLWGLGIEHRDLNEIAAELGSDVPFFLTGGTAIGMGRGEFIEPIQDRKAEHLIIVTPDVAVSTPKAFAAINVATLTTDTLESTLTVCRNEAKDFDPLQSALINDLEASVFAAHPEVRRVKDALADLGAISAAMSGSGASVFAIFDNKETRQAAEKALEQESTWRKFAVSTISRDTYREALAI